MRGLEGGCSDEGHKREEVKRKKNILELAAGMRSPGRMSKRSCELKRRLCVCVTPLLILKNAKEVRTLPPSLG